MPWLLAAKIFGRDTSEAGRPLDRSNSQLNPVSPANSVKMRAAVKRHVLGRPVRTPPTPALSPRQAAC